MTMFNDQIKALNNSVLFNLSLTSKELFHSNFLEWFINTQGDLGRQLANKLAGDDLFFMAPPKADREKKNIDLLIECGKKKLVIENKVKSIPDEYQLDRYSEKFGSDAPRFILLSLIEPMFFEGKKDHKAWRWISYQKLASFLRSSRPQGYYGYITDDYCDFIQTLHDIAELSRKFFENEKSDFLDDSLYEELEEIRLHDLFDKWRFSWLDAKISKTLENERKNPPQGTELKIHSAMTDATGLLELRYIFKDSGVGIGVQLQGRSLRQFVHAKTPEIAIKCANALLGYWFMDENGNSLPGLRRGPEGFCSYSGTFLYRYKKLEKPMSADVVCEIMIKQLGQARTALSVLKGVDHA